VAEVCVDDGAEDRADVIAQFDPLLQLGQGCLGIDVGEVHPRAAAVEANQPTEVDAVPEVLLPSPCLLLGGSDDGRQLHQRLQGLWIATDTPRMLGQHCDVLASSLGRDRWQERHLGVANGEIPSRKRVSSLE
jgi:hypothetical protein